MNNRNLIDPFQMFDDIERIIFGDTINGGSAELDSIHYDSLFPRGNFPAYNVYAQGEEGKQEMVFEVALAGYAKDEIEIKHENDHLFIHLEPIQADTEKEEKKQVLVRKLTRKKAKYKFFAPSSKLDVSKTEATFTDGIVKIVIPFNKESQARKITFKA